ncbi:hypothetical protein BJX62DRAFT_244951 [Aspergillus germanicus]
MRGAFLSLLLATAQVVSGFQIHGHHGMAFRRLDPLVSPGQVSSHIHAAVGSSSFSAELTTEKLVNSKCSNFETQQDKSSYWTSPPMQRHANGSWSALPLTYQVAYYKKASIVMLRDKPITIYPDNFRMMIGSAKGTTNSRTNDWISYQCTNYIPQGDVWGQPQFYTGWKRLPTMDCTIVKMAFTFPYCWDGVNVDSSNHRSHVEYPQGDKCPSTHPVQIPALTLEFEFYAEGVNWEDIYLSCGSASGYAGHADFFFGWVNQGAALKEAMADPTCLDSEGILDLYSDSERCRAMNKYVDLEAMTACQDDIQNDIPLEEVGLQRPIPALPGCNPLFDDPGLPTEKPSCAKAPPTPLIGTPSRLFTLWNHIPNEPPVEFAVHDAKQLPSAYDNNKRAARPQSGTMFLCTGQNWNGHTENWPWKSGVCKTLTGQLLSNIGSAGPNTGICTFFAEEHCKGDAVWSMTNPGNTNLGGEGKRFKSFTCV